MATITPTWTENQTLHASSSVGAGSSVTDDIDLDTNGYDLVVVQIEIAFGGSPDNNVQVDIFGSVNSGTDDDTVAIQSFTISESASTTKRKSVAVMGYPYIAVQVTNNDSADSVTYVGTYAGRQWSSA